MGGVIVGEVSMLAESQDSHTFYHLHRMDQSQEHKYKDTNTKVQRHKYKDTSTKIQIFTPFIIPSFGSSQAGEPDHLLEDNDGPIILNTEVSSFFTSITY